MILLAAEEDLRGLFEAHSVAGDAFWTGAASGEFREIRVCKGASPSRKKAPTRERERSLSKTSLEDFCKSAVREERLKALQTLANLAREAREEVAGLDTASATRRVIAAAQGCHNDKDVQVRITAVGILSEFGEADDEDVIKVLTKALGDWHRPIRSAASQGLLRLANGPSALGLERRLSVFKAARSLLMDTRYQGREEASAMLPDLASEEDPGFVEILAELLDSERTEVRDATVKALAGMAIDHENPKYFEPILRRFGSAFTYTRVSAGRAASLMMRPGPSMRAVAGCLADPDPHVRAVAVRACGNSAPTEWGPALVALLSEMLLQSSSSISSSNGNNSNNNDNNNDDGKNPSSPSSAVSRLQSSGPPMPEGGTFSSSTSAASKWGPEARRGALFALGEMRFVSAATLSTISRSLADTDSSVRLTAITSLSQICRRCGPELRLAALDIAQRALQDPDPLVQDAGELLIAQWEADPMLMQQIDVAEEECSVLSPLSVPTTIRPILDNRDCSAPISPGSCSNINSKHTAASVSVSSSHRGGGGSGSPDQHELAGDEGEGEGEGTSAAAAAKAAATTVVASGESSRPASAAPSQVRPLSAKSLTCPGSERRSPSPDHLRSPAASSRPMSGGSAAATTVPASQRLRGFVAQIRSLRSLASNPRPGEGETLTPLELAEAGLEKLQASSAEDRCEACKLLARAFAAGSARGPRRLEAVQEVAERVLPDLLGALQDLAWSVREAAVETSLKLLESLQKGLERALPSPTKSIISCNGNSRKGSRAAEDDNAGDEKEERQEQEREEEVGEEDKGEKKEGKEEKVAPQQEGDSDDIQEAEREVEGSVKQPVGEVLFCVVQTVADRAADSAAQVRSRVGQFYLCLARLNLGLFELETPDLDILKKAMVENLEKLVQDWTLEAADVALHALLLLLHNEEESHSPLPPPQSPGPGPGPGPLLLWSRRLREAASYGLEHREEKIRQTTLFSLFKRRKLLSAESDEAGVDDAERGRVQDLSYFAGLRLEHFDEVVRGCGVDALERLNCVEACTAAEARLGHAGAPVRSAALRVLERLAHGSGSGGDGTVQRAVEGLTKALGHDDASTRKRALELLEALSMSRRRLGMVTLRLLLQSPADAHRSAAVLACNFTLEVEDLHTLELLVLCIELGGDQAPPLAAACLARFLPLSAPCLWEFVSERIVHPEARVRSTCASLLVGATEKQPGSLVLVASLLGPHMKHKSAEVRKIAAQSLRAVAVHGPSFVGKILAELFSADQQETRETAVEALAAVSQIAGLGDRDLMHYVTIPLSSPADYTRKAAAEALGKVSQAGNSEALSKLMPLLDDPCREVADAASFSLIALNPPLALPCSQKAASDEASASGAAAELEAATAARAAGGTSAAGSTSAVSSSSRSRSGASRHDLLEDITLCLPSCSSISREVRLLTAAKLEMTGTKAVRLAILACLEDTSEEKVREAAIAALETCRPKVQATESDYELVHKAAQLIRHRSAPVRAAAIEVLVAEGLGRSSLSTSDAAPDDVRRRAIAAACTIFESEKWEIREAAVAALQRLVPRTLVRPLEPISVLVKARNGEQWDIVSATLLEVLRAYCDTGRDELPQMQGKVANSKVLVRGHHGRRYLKEYQDRCMLGLH